MEDFIITQLDNNDIEWEITNNDIKVFCPFHQHRFRTKHLHIDKKGLKANCFACEWKGSYNAFAKEMNLALLEVKKKEPSISTIITNLNENAPVLEVLSLPKTTSWEGDLLRFGNGEDIPENILLKYEARTWFDGTDIRCYLPCYNSDCVGYVGLRTFEETKIKTKNMTGTWATNNFFGLQHIKEKCVLVEGVADVLKLAIYNIPAIAILGNTWSNVKRSLLLSKGVKKIILAMDGDTQGRNYTEQIAKDLFPFIQLKFFDYPDGEDPAHANTHLTLLLQKIFNNF